MGRKFVVVVLDLDEGEVAEVIGPFKRKEKAEKKMQPTRDAYMEYDRHTPWLISVQQVTPRKEKVADHE